MSHGNFEKKQLPQLTFLSNGVERRIHATWRAFTPCRWPRASKPSLCRPGSSRDQPAEPLGIWKGGLPGLTDLGHDPTKRDINEFLQEKIV